jgi:hypothetical protein
MLVRICCCTILSIVFLETGARLCCNSTLPHIFTLERGVDALIGLKRSSDDQQFLIRYETREDSFFYLIIYHAM